MEKESIFKDGSVIWAVALLIVMVFLLRYIESTNSASAAINLFGTSTNTSPTTNTNVVPYPIDTGDDTAYYCNTCGATTRDGVKTWFCEKTKFSQPCDDRCQSADDCGSSGGSDGGGSSGGDGTDPDPAPTNPKPSQPTHWVCSSNKECVEIDGAGENECKTHSECGGESPGGGGDIIPWGERTEHWACVGIKCTMIQGPGQDSCYDDSYCSVTQSNAKPNWFTSVVNFFGRIWAGFMGLFSR